jgi:hypothetical protein
MWGPCATFNCAWTTRQKRRLKKRLTLCLSNLLANFYLFERQIRLVQYLHTLKIVSDEAWENRFARSRKSGAGKLTIINHMQERAAGPPVWCLGPESNRHETKFRGILSPLRLPIPPPRHWSHDSHRLGTTE